VESDAVNGQSLGQTGVDAEGSSGPSEQAAKWFLIALTACTRLAVALAHHNSLIGNAIYTDDAFYYLSACRENSQPIEG
jgi:hypothetical protein